MQVFFITLFDFFVCTIILFVLFDGLAEEILFCTLIYLYTFWQLETFKRQLMQSLNEDSLSPTATVDIQTCDHPMPKAYPVQVNESYGYGRPKSQYSSEDSCLTSNDGSRYNSQISMTPYISTLLTPAATPKIISISSKLSS
ncbi:unnamed protein product [Rhodiola kirilowii]